jgi:flagellar hook-associated protein 2
LAKTIQKQIAEDKTLGSRGLRVEEHEGALRFTSGSFGSNSKIEVLPGEEKDLSSIGLDEGTVESGVDVEGTIDGVEALGRGQLLAGAKDTNADGLRLLVTLNEAQLEAGQLEASVTITKGVGVKLRNKLEQFTSPINGEFQRITKDLNEQMRSYDKQVGDLMERMESKQSQLQRKFAKLDSTLGRLKAQQSYVSQQLSAMQGGKKKDD